MLGYPNFNIIDSKISELYRRFSWADLCERDEAYYNRYGLTEEEYTQKWKLIWQSVFDPEATVFPEMVMFRPDFKLFFTMPEGEAITRKLLTVLKRCMRTLGEREFVIMHNELLFRDMHSCTPEATPRKLKFPATITYPKILDGGIHVSMFFIANRQSINQYFVFSESGLWGLYGGGIDEIDPDMPDYCTYILGFREEVAPLFIKYFQDFDTEEGKKYILTQCFPHMPAYKAYKADFITMCHYREP